MDEQPDEAAAKAMVPVCGHRVEVLSERTEYSQTFANPDGSFTFEESMEPVRVRQGSLWVPVDTTLKSSSQGVVPKASVLPQVFSPGGNGPLARISQGGRELTMSWPTRLPAPTLAGNTATYHGVLGPDVDLQMTASALGFSEVLVVRTREAAADPALASVRFGLATKGVTVSATGAGGLVARDARGRAVFESPAPLMWDSPAPAPSAEKPGAEAAGDQSATAAGAGLADGGEVPDGSAGEVHRAVMPVRVADGVLTVTPDAAILSDPATRFPVFIDPAWTGYISGNAWTSVWSKYPSSSFWQNSSALRNGSTYGSAGAGRVEDCDTCADYIIRSFFRMDTSYVKGTHILDAKFRIEQRWSWTCYPSPTNAKVWLTSATSSSTTWNNQPSFNSSYTAETKGNRAYGAPYGCLGVGTIEFNVTSIVDLASKNWSTVTLGLRAKDEGTKNQWKRFNHTTPKLAITFNRKPNTPTNLKSDGKACASGSSRPYVLTTTPTLSATHSDPDGGSPTTSFYWWPLGGALSESNKVSDTRPSGSAVSAAIPSGRLTDGSTYAWKARTFDGTDYGGWSGTCEFTVDATPPPTPGNVTSTDYPASGVHGGVGIAGTFDITAPSTRPYEVVAYAYTLDSGVLTGAPEVPARTSDRGASVTVIPLHDGVNTLRVWSKDHAGRYSATPKTYTFTVRAGVGPAAEWTFDEASGNATDVSLHGNTATVASGATRITGRAGVGKALSLTGGSTSYAVTSGPVKTPHPDTGVMIPVRTDATFTVTARVRLTATGGTSIPGIVAADGTHTSAYFLGYDGPSNKWRFTMVATDGIEPSRATVFSDGTATAGKWTHLSATFDAATKKMRLYVNGVQQATVPTLSGGFNATGAVSIGRRKWNDVQTGFFNGAIDDVRVYNFVEASTKLAELALPLPPTISFPNGATVLAGGQLSVTFDARGDINVTKFRYSVDNTGLGTEVTANTAGGTKTVTVNVGSVLGDHPIYAVTKDDGSRLSKITQGKFTVNPAASLTGQVIEWELGLPLEGANVTLNPGGMSTTTDASGGYSFTGFAPGVYTLSATYGGPCGLVTPTPIPVEITGMGVVQDITLFPFTDELGNTCTEQAMTFAAADQAVLPVSGDDTVAAVDLPFPFPFYGQAYYHAWIDTNGLVSFSDPAGSHPYDGTSLPNGLDPNTMIAAFWDDLVVDAAASVRTAVTGSGSGQRFVIEWRNVHRKDSATQRLSFEVILAPDGTVTTNYTGLDNDAEKGAEAAVGIEAPAGDDGLTYSANEPILANNQAIVFDAPAEGGEVDLFDLSGTLTNAAGAPVVGAAVTLDPTGQTATTGAGGGWSFTDLVADSYTVSSSVGGRCATLAQTQVDLATDTVSNLQLGPDYGGLGYACTEGTGGFVAATDAVFLAGDNEQTQVGLPFGFTFHGLSYGEVTVNTNGYVVFGDDGGASGGAGNQTLPDPAPANGLAAPFWDDLNVDASAGVYTRQLGAAPDRQFVIEWRNVLIVATGDRTSFELVLDENGQIEFRYPTLDTDAERGASATVGLESGTGTAAAFYAHDEAALATDRTIVYAPAAPGVISGSLTAAVTTTPVAGATVTLLPSGATTTTGTDGGYQFTSVPPGEYTVQADTGDGRCAGQYAIRDLHHAAGVSDLDLSVMIDGDEFGYTCVQGGEPFVAADQVLSLTGDDERLQVFPPFPIRLYGATHTTGWIDTNGVVTFRDLGTSAWDASPIPSEAAPYRPNAAVYPFWDDLIVDEQASVRQATLGTAPNRQWVVEWRNVRTFEDPTTRLTFEVIFEESAGDIRFGYADLDPANPVERGRGATVGVEDGSGTLGFQYAYRQAWLESGDSLRFHPLPPGQGTVTGVVSCQTTPVAGATVSVAGQQASTGADGSYSIGGIDAGPYAIIATIASGPCVGSHPEPVTVGTGTTTTVDYGLGATPAGTGHTLVEQPTAFVPADQSVLNALNQDDAYTQISLPFPVVHYGQSYTTAWVDTNGVVSFSAPNGSAWNHGPIPSPPAQYQADAAVYPLWHDWVVDVQASVRTATRGAAPNRQFIVEWRNVHSFLDSAVRVSFEVIFDEGGGYTFAYTDMDGTYLENGGAATIGIENAGGTAALQYTFRHPVLRPGLGVRITPATP